MLLSAAQVAEDRCCAPTVLEYIFDRKKNTTIKSGYTKDKHKLAAENWKAYKDCNNEGPLDRLLKYYYYNWCN